MSIFPKFLDLYILILSLLCAKQSRNQRDAKGANAPTRLNGTPARTSYPPMQGCPSKFSWYTYVASYSRLSSL